MTKFKSACQDWLTSISVMQQSVLMSAIRGPDGFRKHHPAKPLLKWYRRCVLISAFDGFALTDPLAPGGGSFTGPTVYTAVEQSNGPTYYAIVGSNTGAMYESITYAINAAVSDFVHSRDEMTLHYFAHAMHAFEILGYKHPDPDIRSFWNGVYLRMVNALHMMPEDEAEMDRRLGDGEEEWSRKADEAGSCSE